MGPSGIGQALAQLLYTWEDPHRHLAGWARKQTQSPPQVASIAAWASSVPLCLIQESDPCAKGGTWAVEGDGRAARRWMTSMASEIGLLGWQSSASQQKPEWRGGHWWTVNDGARAKGASAGRPSHALSRKAPAAFLSRRPA